MRFPDFLKKGDTAGFIAPSFGAVTMPYRAWFDAALCEFEKRGYRTLTGPNCRRNDGVGKSSTPQRCGDEINEFFTGERCDAIISCGGGETMCEDLEYVDFDAIRSSRPRWFMGYSDNTNLTFTLPVVCNTAAIYGPCAPTLAMSPAHRAVEDAWRLLSGEGVREGCFTLQSYDGWEGPEDGSHETERPEYNITRRPCIRSFVPAGAGREGFVPSSELKISGRLIGGCLDVLRTLAGTRYDRMAGFNNRYGHEGILWFLESCDYSSIEVRRALWQLRSAGWFDAASGFIFGRPFLYDDCSFGMSQQEAVLSALEGLGVPVVIDADLGHLPPSMPVISGAFGSAQFENGKLILEQYLR